MIDELIKYLALATFVVVMLYFGGRAWGHGYFKSKFEYIRRVLRETGNNGGSQDG